MNIAPCQVPSDVGCGVEPLSPRYLPGLSADNCRGGTIMGQQIPMQWWVQPVAVLVDGLLGVAWSLEFGQLKPPVLSRPQTRQHPVKIQNSSSNMRTSLLITILVMITAVTCSPLIRDTHKFGRWLKGRQIYILNIKYWESVLCIKYIFQQAEWHLSPWSSPSKS